MQKSVNDCGIACLTFILNNFGKNVGYDSVKSRIKIDKEGVSAYEIIRVAKTYGITATGYKNYFLNKNICFPFIAHTINNNIQHFVVVLKITNSKKVLISDPAHGMLYVNLDDFKQIYTGIAITFKRNDNFIIKKEIFDMKFIILITSIILFLALQNVSYSYFLSFIIEHLQDDEVIIILILFASIGILKELTNFVKEKILLKYQILTDKAITIPILKRIINLPHSFYQKKSVGELISKINDLSYIKQMVYVSIQVLFVNVIIMIISFIFLFFVHKTTFILNIIVTLLIFLYNSSFYKKNAYKNYDLQVKNEVLNTKISDGLSGIINIKNLCKEDYLENKIMTSYNDVLNNYKDLSILYQKKNLIINILVFITLFSSIIMLIKNQTIISNVLFIIYLEAIIYDGINAICDLLGMYADFKSSYIRINDIYKEKQIDKIISLIDINSINFKNVSYRYKNKMGLKNVNLKIEKNDFIMINGPSGSGKTTLFKMLTKQIKYNGKNILINDKSIGDYSDGEIRRSITYVDQKIKLFNGTVLENISLGENLNLRTNFKQVLDELIEKRNIDYNTIIDNTNSNLSGGEITLILIAQVLNNAGNVIIFDETTSQMDPYLERKVLKAIKEDYKDKTIILISHRLTNKDLFDRIINFSDKKYKTRRRTNERVKTV